MSLTGAPFHRGSVKDVLGPLALAPQLAPSVVFEYTDAYSVFDWGRMPDALARKGEALAVLAAHWFERLEDPATWKEFSRSPEALSLRRGNRFGSGFNDLGETLQATGLRTHYQGLLGPLEKFPPANPAQLVPRRLADLDVPVRHLAVAAVSVVKPTMASVLGRALPDYSPTRAAPLPRLAPLEVVFRFSCPPGSSILERAARDPEYMASIGFGGSKAEAGTKWEFPVLELFTKLESTDRPLTLAEGMAISGLSAGQLQDLLFRTAWVAGCVRWMCAKGGLDLADGKLEWGITATGECLLVDAIGPDELRLIARSSEGAPVQISKEFLRNYYRSTPWYEQMTRAKAEARDQGVSDWKRGVKIGPQSLPKVERELASHLYLALTNRLAGKLWFGDAWSLERVVDGIAALGAASGGALGTPSGGKG